MIQVIDDFVIDSDGTQYVMGRLGKRLNKNKGAIEEFIRDPSYYATFSQAILGVSRRMRAEAIKNTNGELSLALAALKQADMRLIEALKAYDGITVTITEGNHDRK
ncbi:MAG: hypothetical protein SPG80_07100 [Candidatus Ventricola sp.]|nr:hypothetical protein [Clostridiales bacterium]MDY5349297.1 hypothetical protein [Candidatus Ventricola sp.]